MLPTLLNFSWLLIQALTVFSFMVPAVLCFFYFTRRKVQEPEDEELHEEKDYAIIVSVREPSENIQVLLRSLIQLNYTNYLVYITGNHISESNIDLYSDKLVYLRTARTYHSRLLHRFIIENFRRPHTHVVMLNAASRVDKDYLTSLNLFFNQGYQAVASRQAHLHQTGIRNGLQLLVDNYRNFFNRKLVFSLGSSAMVPCAGIAFTISCYKPCLKTKTDTIGFTSMLQMQLTKRGQQVAFASDAVVYSYSKLSRRQLAGQHAQRVHDWLAGLLFACKIIISGIKRKNANLLLSGISSLRMPLSTSLLIAFSCLIVNARIFPAMAFVWTSILLLFPVYLMIAATQFPEQNCRKEREEQTGENTFNSKTLYEPAEEYKAMVQTV